MIFVIGGKGLTGSAIVDYLKKNNIKYEVIQKENKTEFFGKRCKILIFANGNSIRYKANEDPYFDFNASVSSIAEYIHKIDFELFVHLSTVAVYDSPSSEQTTSEDTKINSKSLPTYGYHKLLGEEYIQHYCKHYLIFRLPGIVGNGTRKNPVYDFLHKEKKVMVSSESSYNFINTEDIAESIFKVIHLGITNEIFNLASKNSIKIGDIKKVVNQDSEYTDDAESHFENWQINTKKIQKFVNLTTSEQAIKRYYEQLKKS